MTRKPVTNAKAHGSGRNQHGSGGAGGGPDVIKLKPQSLQLEDDDEIDEATRLQRAASRNPMKTPWGLLMIITAIMMFFLLLNLYDYWTNVVD